MHLHRLRSRTALGWLAAALAAAAAVWTPLAIVTRHWSLVPAAAIGIALAAFRPVWLVAGLLNTGALYLAFLLLLVGGSCDDDGHIQVGVWIAGAVVYAAIAIWALLRDRRAWWGLPLATLVAALVVVGLATLLTGSTGACLS